MIIVSRVMGLLSFNMHAASFDGSYLRYMCLMAEDNQPFLVVLTAEEMSQVQCLNCRKILYGDIQQKRTI